MILKRMAVTSTLAAGIGLAGAFGVGLGTASAQPNQGCDRPGAPSCQHDQRGNPGPAGNDWNNRGMDQGRRDHQPFNWNGQRVTPMQAGNGAGWGFWFLGQWIPL